MVRPMELPLHYVFLFCRFIDTVQTQSPLRRHFEHTASTELQQYNKQVLLSIKRELPILESLGGEKEIWIEAPVRNIWQGFQGLH